MPREHDVEAALRYAAQAHGGRALKLQGGRAGDPDRIVVLPGRRTGFCECKRRTGPTRELQKVRLVEFEAMGYKVAIVKTAAEARAFVAELWSDRMGTP